MSQGFKSHEIEMLKWGRHFRLPAGGRLVVGRKKSENEVLERLARPEDRVLFVKDIPGPVSVLVGGDESDLDLAAAITTAYSDTDPGGSYEVRVLHGDPITSIATSGGPKGQYAELMIR